MITRIIDRYFTNKFTEELLYRLKTIYSLDFKVKKEKREIKILAKPVRHKEYTGIYHFTNNISLYELLRIENIIKSIRSYIDYLGEKDIWK